VGVAGLFQRLCPLEFGPVQVAHHPRVAASPGRRGGRCRLASLLQSKMHTDKGSDWLGFVSVTYLDRTCTVDSASVHVFERHVRLFERHVHLVKKGGSAQMEQHG
jgi:hypothetical protein